MKTCKICNKNIDIRVKVDGIIRTLSSRRVRCIKCQPLGTRVGDINVYRSSIRSVTRDQMTLLIKESLSISHLLDCLGLPSVGGSYKTLHKYCLDLGLSLSELKNKQSRKFRIEILTKGSSAKGNRLKNAMLLKGVPKVCSECGQIPLWNNAPLTLQVDHINGDNRDNRLENLRFLCPNCHSQTPTFAGKNNKGFKNTKIAYCVTCGDIKPYNKSKMCRKCGIVAVRKFNPSIECMINTLKTSKTIVQVASIFGVSDSAVRKRCRLLGLDYKALIGLDVI